MTFVRPYYDTEGPFGLPMKDRQAKALEARLKDFPRDETYGLRRCSFERGLTELAPEARSEVSWITEETPDRAGDVVLARGMDDSHFQLNPIVTLNHAYDQPPVGRSLWRRRVREGTLVGVKAKTLYPERPSTWQNSDWPPDRAFELIQAGLLRGKSIGFFPIKLRAPTADEIARRPAWQNVRFIIEEWLLAEYACCFLPVQPHAVVAEIGPRKSAQAAQLTGSDRAVSQKSAAKVRFTSLQEIAESLPRWLDTATVESALENALQRSWKKLSGRV